LDSHSATTCWRSHQRSNSVLWARRMVARSNLKPGTFQTTHSFSRLKFSCPTAGPPARESREDWIQIGASGLNIDIRVRYKAHQRQLHFPEFERRHQRQTDYDQSMQAGRIGLTPEWLQLQRLRSDLHYPRARANRLIQRVAVSRRLSDRALLRPPTRASTT